MRASWLVRALCSSVWFLALPAAAQDLTRITGVDPVTAVQSSRAVAWADIDGDLDLDLYVTNGGSPDENNELYRNDGGSFVALPASGAALDSLRADGCTFGDFDNDGDEDLFVVSWYGELNALFRNDGAGGFTRLTTGPHVNTGTYSEGCAWVDHDNDGDLDLFVANSGSGSTGKDNLFYRNDGGTFVSLTGLPMVGENSITRQCAWADYDNDGDVDLFLANEAGENNRLFENRLVPTGLVLYQEIAGSPVTSDGGDSFSASWGDFDNDGDLDLIVGNHGGENNFLYRNQLAETGSATFAAVTDQDPVLNKGWVVGTHWADWDNDADLDLLFTNGNATTASRTRKNFFYRNDGGTLVRVTTSAAAADSGWSYAGAWADYDDDGDLDLAVANWQGQGQANYLYRNEAQNTGNHWLKVRCRGTASNRSGIGARVRVVATVGGTPLSQIREIAGSDGYCSQNLVAHFGLADAAAADSLIVRWPSGTEQVFTGIAADQALDVTEASSVGVPLPPTSPHGALIESIAPNPFRTGTELSYSVPAGGRVEVSIVDAAGRLVRRWEERAAAAGRHALRWDGADGAGRPVASGLYFVRLATEGKTSPSSKLLRLR